MFVGKMVTIMCFVNLRLKIRSIFIADGFEWKAWVMPMYIKCLSDIMTVSMSDVTCHNSNNQSHVMREKRALQRGSTGETVGILRNSSFKSKMLNMRMPYCHV